MQWYRVFIFYFNKLPSATNAPKKLLHLFVPRAWPFFSLHKIARLLAVFGVPLIIGTVFVCFSYAQKHVSVCVPEMCRCDCSFIVHDYLPESYHCLMTQLCVV